MSEAAALQKLLTWLSPAFPVGAFAYSAGLEQAIAAGRVHDRATVSAWIEGALRHGGLRTDAILLAQAHKASAEPERLAELADLARALAPARQRLAEMHGVGEAFLQAASAWPCPVLETLPRPCPYPVAVGAVAAGHDLPLGLTLTAFLTAAVQGQVSVAVRLVPLGQVAGLAVQAGLELLVAQQAEMAAGAGIDDLAAIGYAADIAQMHHETLEPRLFRS